MTTIVKITNEGQESATIWYYGEDRQFKQDEKALLAPGESITVTVWNGNLPLIMPARDPRMVENKTDKFYGVPPCSM